MLNSDLTFQMSQALGFSFVLIASARVYMRLALTVEIVPSV